MTITELLTQQAQDAHGVFLGTIEGLTDDQANYQPSGTALSVAATWVHHVEAEDNFMCAITGEQPLEATDFAGKTGFSESQPISDWAETFPAWSHSVKVDVAQLVEYTKSVFAKTETTIATLTEDQLHQQYELGAMGNPTGLTIISSYVIAHCGSITGEISAIKGLQGLKGYPF